jgi:short-subunit dehydrogenase
MNGQGRARTALVTGASGGIGLEIARLVARDGARVLMVARDEERLRRAAGWVRGESPTAETLTLATDLASPGAASVVAAWVQAEAGPIDFLVNNAGVGAGGRFATGDTEVDQRIVALNVVALMELTRAFLPEMIARGRGRILNVASVAGFLPGPMMAVYYASKAFVLSFSDALAEECRDTGVTVTALCPGPTLTGFQRRAGIERAGPSGRLRGRLVMQAGPVAQAGYQGALAGRRIVVPGLANKVIVQLLRLMPRAGAAALVRRVNAGIE